MDHGGGEKHTACELRAQHEKRLVPPEEVGRNAGEEGGEEDDDERIDLGENQAPGFIHRTDCKIIIGGVTVKLSRGDGFCLCVWTSTFLGVCIPGNNPRP